MKILAVIIVFLVAGCGAGGMQEPIPWEAGTSTVVFGDFSAGGGDVASGGAGAGDLEVSGGTGGAAVFPDASDAAVEDSGVADAGDAAGEDTGVDAGDAGSADSGLDAGDAGAGGAGGSDAGVDAGSDAGAGGAGGPDAGADAGGADSGTDAGANDAGADAGTDAGASDAGSDGGLQNCGSAYCAYYADVDPDAEQWMRQSFLRALVQDCDGGQQIVACPSSAICRFQAGASVCVENCGDPDWPEYYWNTRFLWDVPYEVVVDARGCGATRWWEIASSVLPDSVTVNLLFAPYQVIPEMGLHVYFQLVATPDGYSTMPLEGPPGADYAEVSAIWVGDYKWTDGESSDLWTAHIRADIVVSGTHEGRLFTLELTYRDLVF